MTIADLSLRSACTGTLFNSLPVRSFQFGRFALCPFPEYGELAPSHIFLIITLKFKSSNFTYGGPGGVHRRGTTQSLAYIGLKKSQNTLAPFGV